VKPDPLEPFEDRDPIEEAAVAWLIERDEGFAPGRAAEFDRWRQSHPRHAAAVERLEETWGLLEELPALAAKEPVPFPATVPRARHFRAALWAPLAAAAAIMLAFGWWRSEARNLRAHYTTVAGALQRIGLPDGSVVTLNAGSEAGVRYSAQARHVRLIAGEAHFEVARDAARPFLVEAGGISVRALGTAFNVRVAAAAVEVVVASGQVRLTAPPQSPAAPSAALAAAPLLERGDRAIVARDTAEIAPAITRLEPAQLREALAWQQEMLIFTETPLRDVVAQFNRRNRTQLRLGDADLGARLIGGTFAAGNVEAFVSLLERGGDLTTERRGEHEIVLRQGR
jgi:transmembrane sensor